MYASTQTRRAAFLRTEFCCGIVSVAGHRKTGCDDPEFPLAMVTSHATRQSTVRDTAYNSAVPVPEILCEFAPDVPAFAKTMPR